MNTTRYTIRHVRNRLLIEHFFWTHWAPHYFRVLFAVAGPKWAWRRMGLRGVVAWCAIVLRTIRRRHREIMGGALS